MASAKTETPAPEPFPQSAQEALDRAVANGEGHVSIAGSREEIELLAKLAKAQERKAVLGPIGVDGRGKVTISLPESEAK